MNLTLSYTHETEVDMLMLSSVLQRLADFKSANRATLLITSPNHYGMTEYGLTLYRDHQLIIFIAVIRRSGSSDIEFHS